MGDQIAASIELARDVANARWIDQVLCLLTVLRDCGAVTECIVLVRPRPLRRGDADRLAIAYPRQETRLL
jgi:hypothetical protein